MFAIRLQARTKIAATAVAMLLSAGQLAGCAGGGSRGLQSGAGLIPSQSVQTAQAAQNAHAALRIADPLGGEEPRGTSPIALKPSRLTVYGTGKQSATKEVVYEKGYTGKFTEVSTCSKVAKPSATSGKGPTFTLTFEGVAKGTCDVEFADSKGHKTKLDVADKSGGQFGFTLIVPTKGAARHNPVRRPHYISPATQGMVVDISGPTTVSIVSGLTNLTSGCTIQLQGLECTFGTSLASCPTVGDNCYTATVTTYDAYDASTDTIPSGAAPLSIAKDTFTIADNQANTVDFPFSGIPANIVIVPGSSLSYSSGNVIDLIGPGAHPLYAEALDADQNVIAGTGGPTFQVSVSGNLAATVTQPPTGSPRFTATPPTQLAEPSSLATLQATATYPTGDTDGCAVKGAVCSGAVTLDMQSLLAVVSSYSVALYAAEKGIGPISTITSGVGNGANDIQFDASGNLYAAQGYGGIVEYALGSTLPSRTITNGVSNAIKLAIDPAGNVFALNLPYGATTGTVTEYTPTSSSPVRTVSISVPNPTALAVDSSDDFWVASQTAGAVAYYANGSSTPVMLTGLVQPVGLAVDANKTLYVSDETYTVVNQSAQCGVNGNYCTIYSYPYGSTSPTIYASQSWGGHLVYVPPIQNEFLGGLFADDSTGTETAWYPANFSPPVTPSGWTSSAVAQGAASAIAADELGNVFVSTPFSGSVYEFLYDQFENAGSAQQLTPHTQLTNGLTFPSALAIVP